LKTLNQQKELKMKTAIVISLACGLLAWSGFRTAAATGDWADNFDQPTIQTNWQSAISVYNATYPVDWRISDGSLKGYWSHFGQQHLTVQGPGDQCIIQVRCRLDRAGHAQSGALLVLRAEDPAIQHPGVGAANFYAFGLGNGNFVFGRMFESTYDFPKTESRPGLEVGTWHTLKAQIEGSHIRCFLDDEMVFETTDTSFTGSYYGVGAALNADVTFDDFQITTIPTVATSRAVATGQLIDTGWPMGSGSQEKVTFMMVVDPAVPDPTDPIPANATVVMDSPAIRNLFGNTLVLQGTPESYVEGDNWTQDAKVDKALTFKTGDKLCVVGFNDNSLPGNHPDPAQADWAWLIVTDAQSGNTLLSIYGPLTAGDVMDYVQPTAPPVSPALSVCTMTRVSWPYSLSEFALEGSESVNGDWQPVDAWVIQQDGQHQAFLPLTSPTKLFRLKEVE
jgi:hypothetical protein